MCFVPLIPPPQAFLKTSDVFRKTFDEIKKTSDEILNRLDDILCTLSPVFFPSPLISLSPFARFYLQINAGIQTQTQLSISRQCNINPFAGRLAPPSSSGRRSRTPRNNATPQGGNSRADMPQGSSSPQEHAAGADSQANTPLGEVKSEHAAKRSPQDEVR